MKTIQDMYVKFEDMSMGTKPYGVKVHAEVELLPNIRYALKEHREFRSYPRVKTVTHYEVTRFEYVKDEFGEYWNQTSSVCFDRKSDAKKMFKVSTT